MLNLCLKISIYKPFFQYLHCCMAVLLNCRVRCHIGILSFELLGSL